jgi:hypothetical protein
MKNSSKIHINTCGSQGNVKIIFVNSSARKSLANLGLPADFPMERGSAGNFVLRRLFAAKSSGIPADYVTQENPQEKREFLVVCNSTLFFSSKYHTNETPKFVEKVDD